MPDCWLQVFSYLEHHDTYALLLTSKGYYELSVMLKVDLDRLYPQHKRRLMDWFDIDEAAGNGYLEVVKWLRYNLPT